MPTHTERRTLPYTAAQLYAIVADIERYPDFLPWCRASRIKQRDGDRLRAEMVIGFKVFREKFTSDVALTPSETVAVTHVDGPFRRLTNHWRFTDREDGQADVEFYVDFEFRSRLLQTTVQALFAEAVRRMVAAFEGRAAALYGVESA
ncbi:MAG: type II toxin-antitoxin system RatA family toxin [Pseudomonadota bacterium]